MLGLAVDTNAGPWNGFKAGWSDFVFAFRADSICSLVDPVDGFFDGPEQFRVGLLESQADMNIVFLAGLIDPITAFRAGLRGGGASGR